MTRAANNWKFFPGNLGLVHNRVAASSAAWGWQSSESSATIPKSFGFEAATRYGASNQCYPEYDLFEPCPKKNYAFQLCELATNARLPDSLCPHSLTADSVV